MKRPTIRRSALVSDVYDPEAEQNPAGVVSRRHMLGISGAAAVGASPVLRALDATSRGPFRMVATRTRVAFWLGGREAWVIDTRRFGGRPILSLVRSESSIHIRLAGATFPGTELSADLDVHLHRGIAGWRITLKLPLGHFHASGPFERWLAGAESLQARGQLSESTVPLDARASLHLGGSAEATFTPDWILRLDGESVASLSGLGGEAHGDHLSIRLLSRGAPSVLSSAPARRTLFALERGRTAWSIDEGTSLEHASGEGWVLDVPENAFDRITIETGETRTGRMIRALVASGSPATPALRFSPGPRMTGGSGERAVFELIQPRFAVAFHTNGRGVAISARMAGSHWAHHGPISLHLAPADDQPEFTLVARDGAVTSVRFEPQLMHTSAPLADAVVLPAAAPAGSRVTFVQGARPRNQGGVHHLDISQRAGPHGTPVLSGVNVVRADDLLVLYFEFINMQVSSGTKGPVLQATNPKLPSYLAVHLQFQHVSEQAFDVDEGDSLSFPPVRAEAAEETRLVFEIPSALFPLPYSLTSLLNWQHYNLSVAPLAVAPHARPGTDPATGQAPFVRPPATNETSIVLPYKLTISPPDALSASDATLLPTFSHSIPPVSQGSLSGGTELTELWHTRYAQLAPGSITESEDLPTPLTARAIYSPDYLNRGGGIDPFRMSLTPEDRYEIVALTTSFQGGPAGVPPQPYDPIPIDVYRMMLSALGGWLDSLGVWDGAPPAPGLDLDVWRHQAAMGRDQYVRVAYKGRLFPFGHRALFLRITERRFDTSEGRNVAFLFQQEFVVVKQPVKDYLASDYPAPTQWPAGYEGRKMPLKSVRIASLSTPPLAGKQAIPTGSDAGGGDYAFWPLVNGPGGITDFLWHIVAKDVLGEQLEFTMPLVFVPETAAESADALTPILSEYLGSVNLLKRERNMAGQAVGFTVVGPAVAGDDAGAQKDPSLKTQSLRFGADIVPKGTVLPQGQASFYPTMGQASVFIPAVEHLLGQSTPTVITFEPTTYLPHAFDTGTNQGQVWALLKGEDGHDSSVGLAYGHSGGGGSAPVTPGVATPNMTIVALSAAHGPIGGDPANLTHVQQYASGSFQPADYFSSPRSPSPQLLGGITLASVLAPIVGGDAFHSATPKLVTQSTGPSARAAIIHAADEPPPPPGTQIKMDWTTKHLTSAGPLEVSEPSAPADEQTQLDIHLALTIPRDSSVQPSFEFKGHMTNFKLNFTAIIVSFDKCKFAISTNKGVSVDPSISEVHFGGFLQFLEDLRSLIAQSLSPYGFVDLQPDHVEVGFQFPLPDITAGVFSLTKVVFKAGFKIPFFGDPVVFQFQISEEDHHFLVVIWIFGGGGYFNIEIGLDGVRALDALIEVGAAWQFSLGPLSGGVKAMLGVHLHYEESSHDVTLTGYLHLGGNLDFAGIVSVSLEIDFDLHYDISTKKLSGDASITFSVKVFLFSVSFHATAHKEFNSGSASGHALAHARPADAAPTVTIATMITDAQWAEYCHAFA